MAADSRHVRPRRVAPVKCAVFGARRELAAVAALRSRQPPTSVLRSPWTEVRRRCSDEKMIHLEHLRRGQRGPSRWAPQMAHPRQDIARLATIPAQLQRVVLLVVQLQRVVLFVRDSPSAGSASPACGALSRETRAVATAQTSGSRHPLSRRSHRGLSRLRNEV